MKSYLSIAALSLIAVTVVGFVLFTPRPAAKASVPFEPFEPNTFDGNDILDMTPSVNLRLWLPADRALTEIEYDDLMYNVSSALGAYMLSPDDEHDASLVPAIPLTEADTQHALDEVDRIFRNFGRSK